MRTFVDNNTASMLLLQIGKGVVCSVIQDQRIHECAIATDATQIMPTRRERDLMVTAKRPVTQAAPVAPPPSVGDGAPAARREPKVYQGSILVVDDEEHIRKLMGITLRRAGYDVTFAVDGNDALARLSEARPDVILSDVMMPQMDGLQLVTALRADAATRTIPVILLTARGASDDIVTGLDLGADDYLPKPFAMAELLARVRAKIERPPIPHDEVLRDRQTGLLTARRFDDEMRREVARAQRSGVTGCVAYVQLAEMPRLRERLGQRVAGTLARQIADLLYDQERPLDLIGRGAEGHFLLLLPLTDASAASRHLRALAVRLNAERFETGNDSVSLTPTIGFTTFSTVARPPVHDQARAALRVAAQNLDLLPVCYAPGMDIVAAPSPHWQRVKLVIRQLGLPTQIFVTQIISFILPFCGYALLSALGFDITPVVYIVVVVALVGTALLIWVESILALRQRNPPPVAEDAYPAATAIIAAYLPNETATIITTVETVLRLNYPGPLQVILAYNTPHALAVEATLQEIARRDPRFVAIRVVDSTSKAQNVNAVLGEVTGAFIGIFDADHQPAAQSFQRAWRWLADGADIVQGHCVIRNGADSWVSRMVAVEFEAIYAISHPGRARLHGFGIFGGANGFWRADVLRQTRLYGFMLTEDIDSSIRALEHGRVIVSDPYLISHELAPLTLGALWDQRMRWAQGWFQVSKKYLWYGLRSPHLSLRQKLGLFHLLGWREVYPWLSVQMIPIISFWAWRFGGLYHLRWTIPLFVVTTIFTLSTGPMQVLFAWRVSVPEIRRHPWWFLTHLLIAPLFYTTMKNTIATIAQIKEVMRDREWKVTPRGRSQQTPTASMLEE